MILRTESMKKYHVFSFCLFLCSSLLPRSVIFWLLFWFPSGIGGQALGCYESALSVLLWWNFWWCFMVAVSLTGCCNYDLPWTLFPSRCETRSAPTGQHLRPSRGPHGVHSSQGTSLGIYCRQGQEENSGQLPNPMAPISQRHVRAQSAEYSVDVAPLTRQAAAHLALLEERLQAAK